MINIFLGFWVHCATPGILGRGFNARNMEELHYVSTTDRGEHTRLVGKLQDVSTTAGGMDTWIVRGSLSESTTGGGVHGKIVGVTFDTMFERLNGFLVAVQ